MRKNIRISGHSWKIKGCEGREREKGRRKGEKGERGGRERKGGGGKEKKGETKEKVDMIRRIDQELRGELGKPHHWGVDKVAGEEK